MKHDVRDMLGRYHQGFDAMCKCGHTLGAHLGEGPVSKRACIVHELPDGPPTACRCQGFRKRKEKALDGLD